MPVRLPPFDPETLILVALAGAVVTLSSYMLIRIGETVGSQVQGLPDIQPPGPFMLPFPGGAS